MKNEYRLTSSGARASSCVQSMADGIIFDDGAASVPALPATTTAHQIAHHI